MRFPEFTGEWKITSFSSNLEKLENGATYNANDTIGVPMSRIETISSGRIDYSKVGYCSTPDKIMRYKMQYGDILFSHINSIKHIGKTAYYMEELPLYHGMNLLLLRCNHNIDSKFFFYLINNIRFLHHCQILAKQAVNQASISISDLKGLTISIPPKDEQLKIQKLLSLIDDRIDTQNKIIEDLKKLKCAIIDYTFDNKPQSHRKRIFLSDVSVKITRRNTDNQNFNVLSNSANQGIIPQSEVFDREIANENNTSNYFVISQNDFVYNPRKSVTAPYGPINRYNGETDGVISPLYLCFRCYGIDVEYLGWYFKSDSWHKYVYQNGDTGVRHDRVSIKDEIFFSMPLYLHSTEEQKRIAKRLNKIESIVSQEEKYLFLLRSQKLYLLQQMFI